MNHFDRKAYTDRLTGPQRVSAYQLEESSPQGRRQCKDLVSDVRAVAHLGVDPEQEIAELANRHLEHDLTDRDREVLERVGACVQSGVLVARGRSPPGSGHYDIGRTGVNRRAS